MHMKFITIELKNHTSSLRRPHFNLFLIMVMVSNTMAHCQPLLTYPSYMHLSHGTILSKYRGHCQPLSQPLWLVGLRIPLTNSLNSYIVQVLLTHSRFTKIIALNTNHINTNIFHTMTHFVTQLYYEPTYSLTENIQTL